MTEEKRITEHTEGNVDGDNSIRKVTSNNQKSTITPSPGIREIREQRLIRHSYPTINSDSSLTEPVDANENSIADPELCPSNCCSPRTTLVVSDMVESVGAFWAPVCTVVPALLVATVVAGRAAVVVAGSAVVDSVVVTSAAVVVGGVFSHVMSSFEGAAVTIRRNE